VFNSPLRDAVAGRRAAWDVAAPQRRLQPSWHTLLLIVGASTAE